VSTPVSERTRVRRIPDNAVHDRGVLDAILDAGLVAHLAVTDDKQPFVLPVAYARRGDEVVFHGSTGSRLFRALADGAPTCLTVTLLDGLVLARSAFHSSMHYRSAMVLGEAHRLTGDDELEALRVITDHLLPGRWSECRHPNAKERAGTMTLALPLEEWSVKVGTGDPEDEPEDITDAPYASVWAGTVPIRESFGAPMRSADCPGAVPVPAYVRDWVR
jgi:nitroimidazol reductase NimA-like FMN-containing flavoprotein (pyridoxamine 5'-phosphate oxidase superfamily)